MKHINTMTRGRRPAPAQDIDRIFNFLFNVLDLINTTLFTLGNIAMFIAAKQGDGGETES
jgi:hypothetical protein